MTYQWAGALLIIAGCGGCGFSMAAEYLREEYSLRQLISALDYMFCELQYSVSPLPQICGKIANEFRAPLGQVFGALSRELESCPGPSAASCMEKAMEKSGKIPGLTQSYLKELGFSLGKFDLAGQLSALDTLRTKCRSELERLMSQRSNRIRNYQTLGLCTGAALAIILI